MRHLNRIRIAALSAAFFLGGLTAAGVGIKATQDSGSKPVTARPRTQLIHETRTRTVHVKAGRTNPSAAPPAQSPSGASQVQPISQAQVPTRVRSRVSPTGGGHEGDDGGEGEGRDD
jgi:hypothetical protein